MHLKLSPSVIKREHLERLQRLTRVHARYLPCQLVAVGYKNGSVSKSDRDLKTASALYRPSRINHGTRRHQARAESGRRRWDRRRRVCRCCVCLFDRLFVFFLRSLPFKNMNHNSSLCDKQELMMSSEVKWGLGLGMLCYFFFYLSQSN